MDKSTNLGGPLIRKSGEKTSRTQLPAKMPTNSRESPEVWKCTCKQRQDCPVGKCVLFASEPIKMPACVPRTLLPLGLLALNKSLEDGNNLVQSLQVLAHLLVNLSLVRTKLAIEILAVRASAHGGAEDGLDEEAVVRLKGDAVGVAEGLGKFVLVVGQVLAQGDACELEAAITMQRSILATVLGVWGTERYLTEPATATPQ